MTIEVIKGSKIQSSPVIRRSRGAKIERTRTRNGRNSRRRPGPCRHNTPEHQPRADKRNNDTTRNGFWGWIVTPWLLKQTWRPVQSSQSVLPSKYWNDKIKSRTVQGRKAPPYVNYFNTSKNAPGKGFTKGHSKDTTQRVME